MGVVWAAEHLVTGKSVALKLLKSRDVTSVRRFLREAKIAGTLAHPGIVAVHDVLQLDDGTPALVMDLLEGESLAQRIAAAGRLPADEVARMLLPVVDAVAAAHARGVVHRDLKPENVHLSPRGDRTHVTVLDFGIAKVLEPEARAVTQTGAVLGTPHYMAPEQVFGDRTVDGAVDVWSLGVILYEALSGQRPFEGENYGQVFKAVALGEAPRLPAEVDQRLAGLVARMLERDRDARPPLSEVRAVLAKVGGASALDSRPTLPPFSSAPAAPSGRGGRLVAVGALGALALTGFLLVRPRLAARPVAPTPAAPVVTVAPLVSVSATSVALPSVVLADAVPPVTSPGPPPSKGSVGSAKPPVAAMPPPTPPTASAPKPEPASTKLPGGVHGVSPY